MSRVELLILVALMVSGFILRSWRIDRVGLDHFDEGVYVFSALGLSDPSQPHRLYPTQTTNSPPVYFSLVGLSYWLLGQPSDRAAILVNVLLGTLTIAAVWWVGRRWFCVPAGIASAALLAFSEYHIAISRSALTDTSFALVFLLALAAIVMAIEHQNKRLAIVAGLTVGVAWNTKYHGWFALLIAAGALLLSAWYFGAGPFPRRRVVVLWSMMAVVAAACYLPWALYVQSQPGGYTALMQIQHTFLSRRWLHNFILQAQQQLFLEGPLSRSSALVALLCVSLTRRKQAWSTRRFVLTSTLLSVSGLVLGGAGTAAFLALLAIPELLRDRASFPVWVFVSSLAVWLLSTPLYTPYARLALPFTVTSHLGAGAWIATALNQRWRVGRPVVWRPALAAIQAGAVATIAILMPDPSSPWGWSRGVPEAALRMQSSVPPGCPVVVIGEPSLAFYLHLAGRPSFEMVRLDNDLTALESLERPMYVVAGVYARRAPSLRGALRRLQPRLVHLGTFEFAPKDLRLLDDYDTGMARRYRVHPDRTFDLELYCLVPMRRAGTEFCGQCDMNTTSEVQGIGAYATDCLREAT